MLREAGWYPGRSTDSKTLDEWQKVIKVKIPPPVEAVFKEFGGLEFGTIGPGLTMARTTVDINPLHARWDSPVIQRLAKAAGVEALYPLGIFGDGDGLILMDSFGSVYVDYDMDSPAGRSFDEAIIKLLLGIKWS